MQQVPGSAHGRGDAASPTQLSAISRLSAIATELVAIRQHLDVGDDAGRGLDDVVAGLDATVTALLHATPVSVIDVVADVDDRPGRPGRVLSSGDRRGSDQFLAWLADPAMPDELAASAAWSAEPVSQLLGRLSNSARGLRADEATVVGMSAGTSVGDAAVALLLAVEEPGGPRCRSFRAAASYLQGLASPVTDRPAGSSDEVGADDDRHPT